MLREESFWKDEKEAPILQFNKGYLQQQGDQIFTRVGNWLSLAGVKSPAAPIPLVHVETPDRLFMCDSERTFSSTANRERHAKLVAHMDHTFDDYAQAMCMVCGFLRLTLPESDVITLVTKLNYDEKYVPGYWKAVSVASATDAYVMQELALKLVPDVAGHLKKCGVDPRLYCQKFYLALGVPNIPFEHLFTYFEGFLKHGFKFLIRFSLSLLNQMRELVLGNNQVHQLAGMLMLDPAYFPHDDKFHEIMRKTFAGVDEYTDDLNRVNFGELRERNYNTYIKDSLKTAAAILEDVDEIEDCEICKDDFPEVKCAECNLKICETCHNDPPASSSHSRSHKVKQIEEDDEASDKSDEESDEDEENDEKVDKAAASLEKLKV